MVMQSRDTRTTDSVVWRSTTGGTTAWEITSSVRFSWDKYQTMIFHNFLRTVGLNYKNCDLIPLLVQLNLNGYENIKNRYGQNVHSIIVTKVQRKIYNTAQTIDENVLKAAILGTKPTGQSNNYGYTRKPTNNQHPPPNKSPIFEFQFVPPRVFPTPPSGQVSKPDESSSGTRHSKEAIREPDTPGEEVQEPPVSLHPFLKMPAKKPRDNPAETVSIKREPESTPQHPRTPSKGGQASEAANNHLPSPSGHSTSRGGTTTPSSGSQNATLHDDATPTPTTATTPPAGSSQEGSALQVLSKRLSVLAAALRGVELAIENVAMEEKDSEWEAAVDDLSLGIHDMKIDVTCLQEIVEQRRDE
ncbi:hypothetical protein F4809DRAFT_645470 [Biscogniauxia mediterranea]|nr:hypothetical protein F4809DRAFT_645470 [Biscogniauxia mediterranea]